MLSDELNYIRDMQEKRELQEFGGKQEMEAMQDLLEVVEKVLLSLMESQRKAILVHMDEKVNQEDQDKWEEMAMKEWQLVMEL